MITVTTEWTSPDIAGPWIPSTHDTTDALRAVQLIGTANFYDNTRPVSWAATTEAERVEMRDMLAARPYLAYMVEVGA